MLTIHTQIHHTGENICVRFQIHLIGCYWPTPPGSDSISGTVADACLPAYQGFHSGGSGATMPSLASHRSSGSWLGSMPISRAYSWISDRGGEESSEENIQLTLHDFSRNQNKLVNVSWSTACLCKTEHCLVLRRAYVFDAHYNNLHHACVVLFQQCGVQSTDLSTRKVAILPLLYHSSLPCWEGI